MKKTIAAIAAVAFAGVLGVTASGCNRGSVNLASLASNWYYDAEFDGIQPTFEESNGAEVVTYSVKQTEKSSNARYSVEYSEGTYKTTFCAKALTAAQLSEMTDPDDENRRQEYLDAFKNGGMLYYYKTELSIGSVTFKCGDGEPAVFENETVTSESYFRAVSDRLSPVYSVRTVKRHVPVNWQPSSVEECYFTLDREYKSYYNLAGTDVKTVETDYALGGAENIYAQGGISSSNSAFDLSYLDVVARAMKNKGTSQNVNVYSPCLPVRTYTLAGGAEPLSADGEKAAKELADIQNVLKEKNLFSEGTDPEAPATLATASVTVSYNGGSFSGVAQRYWFAAAQDGKNTARTMLVKYSLPLYFGLGTLEYVITGIEELPA